MDYSKPKLTIVNFSLEQQYAIHDWLVEKHGFLPKPVLKEAIYRAEIILNHTARWGDKDKEINFNDRVHRIEPDELSIDLDKGQGMIQVEEWINYHFPSTPQLTEDTKDMNNNTPSQPPDGPIPSVNPYDIMVTDIINRIMPRLPKQELDIAGVQQIVEERISKQGRLLITVEDRRKSPTEIKDINEPVHCKMPDVIGILKSGCWCCAVGPSGSGKTLGALQYAKIATIPIICVKQMSRMLAPHDLTGFIDANGKYRAGAWTNAILGRVYDNSVGDIPQGEVVGDIPSIILIDEMDNANENIIMLVKALPTGLIQMPYGPQRINPNLSVMATMNTWGTGATREYVGRMAQDAALLNEFSFVEWDYDVDFEWQLLERLFLSYKDPGEYTLQHMGMLHSMIKGMRAKAEAQKIRVIISTRNLINIARKLLENPGWSIHKVLIMDIYKGLKEEDIKRVECPEQWTAKHNNVKGSPQPKKAVLQKDGTVKDIPF